MPCLRRDSVNAVQQRHGEGGMPRLRAGGIGKDGMSMGMEAEIRRERGIYAVYVRGKHYASCDSLHEAQEEIDGMKSAPQTGRSPGAQTKQTSYSICQF